MSEASTVRDGEDQRVTESGLTREELLGEVQLLAAENARLRAQRENRVRRSYRRAAAGFFVLGVLAAVAALAVPESQTVLFSLAGVGLFVGVLTFWLTPSQVISAPIGDRVYSAYAATGRGLVTDLDLQETGVYVPAPTHTAEAADVRLFVPQARRFVVPKASELESLLVVGGDDRARGVSLVPTGAALLAAFEEGRGDPASTVEEFASQLADALVEGFELVDGATATVDPDGGAITIGIRGSSFGAVDRFDHPVGSFVAAALAAELDTPVRMETRAADDRRSEFVVDCRWGEVGG
ncbi:hypothetical protein [Salinigranum halophilum]|uniref:hypothetical protein n=1 Tax=Salinigranum halophilum TaxID=2565931 RepID=UPI0010A94434|nr:hypothetical protein [Salinigranum halophilum]